MLKKTLLAYTIGFAFSPPANADGIEIAAVDFDRETLKSLGVDPNISHYFSRSARFLPGEYSLIVSVNGEKKGNIATRFDENGDICLDQAFLQQAGLKIPSEEKNGCYDYILSYPGTTITPLPNQEALDIIVSPQAIIPIGLDLTNAATGGTAALLNYSLMSSRAEFSNGSSDYSRLHLKAGLILMTGCYAAISSLHKQMAHSVTRTRQPTFNVPLQILKHSCEQVKLTSIIACWKEPVFTVSKSHRTTHCKPAAVVCKLLV